MPLTQLIYVSRLTQEMTVDALRSIVAQSEAHNRKRDITGVLLCCGQHIMQLLEGEESAVNSLFEKIRADERHTHVQVLFTKAVSRRLFPEWGMEIADLSADFVLNRDRLERLLDDIRLENDTRHYSVEARVLLHDFRQQLLAA